MKKRVNNIYNKYLTIDNLYKCWNIVKITCKNKKNCIQEIDSFFNSLM